MPVKLAVLQLPVRVPKKRIIFKVLAWYKDIESSTSDSKIASGPIVFLFLQLPIFNV
jgi:hypothetical protein